MKSQNLSYGSIILVCCCSVWLFDALGVLLRPFYFSLLTLTVLIPNVIKNNSIPSHFLLFVLFIAISVFDSWIGNDFFNADMSKKSLPIFFVVFISQYYLLNRGWGEWIICSKILICVLFIPIVSSVIVVLFFPTLSSVRWESYNEILDKSYVQLFQLSYCCSHAIPSLIPYFVCRFKHKNDKFLSLSAIFLILYILIACSITTSFLLGVVIFLMSFFVSDSKSKNMWLFCMAILCMVALNTNIVSNMLDVFSGISGNDMFANKMDSIMTYGTYAEDDTNQVADRLMRYRASWNTFFEHPLGAWDTITIGGHSCIVDIFAYFGIPVALLLFFFLYKQFRFPVDSLNPSISFFYILSFFPFIGLLFLKGITVCLSPSMMTILTIIIPGLFKQFDNEHII